MGLHRLLCPVGGYHRRADLAFQEKEVDVDLLLEFGQKTSILNGGWQRFVRCTALRITSPDLTLLRV